MILLTKINNAPIAVNSDLIQYIEETPDTVITMTTSDKVVVKQKMTEIIERIIEYRRHVSCLLDRDSASRTSTSTVRELSGADRER